MYTLSKQLGAVIFLSILGLYLIWAGITGNVIKTIDHENLIPRRMYVSGGIALLIFPAVWILVRVTY